MNKMFDTENTPNVLSIETVYIKSPVDFNNVVDFFLNYIDNLDINNIIFSQAHVNIFYTLDPICRKKQLINLVNIDHHHDIWYQEVPLNSFNSSNWLGYYLNKKDFIDNIYWLANYDSDRNNHPDLITITYDIKDIKFKKFDYVFVCNSPNYSNLLSETAFETLINIVKHVKKCKKFDFFKPNLVNHFSKNILIND